MSLQPEYQDFDQLVADRKRVAAEWVVTVLLRAPDAAAAVLLAAGAGALAVAGLVALHADAREADAARIDEATRIVEEEPA